jgi:hypothetical protein
MEEDWTFSTPFDFIHARYLAGAVFDWRKLAKQCFEYPDPIPPSASTILTSPVT